MKEAVLIYPHQLFATHSALAPGRIVYLIEEPLFLTEFPIHTQKLLLHRLSLQAYKLKLETAGHQVRYLAIQTLTDTASVFTHLATEGVTHLHIVDTTDTWLERRIAKAAAKHNFTLTRYESPLFILSKAEAIDRYQNSKKLMANFYKTLRHDKHIFVTPEGLPRGGKWSFDADNRKKVPTDLQPPADIQVTKTNITKGLAWLETVAATRYGEAAVWLPTDHAGAQHYLERFLQERLANFGTYEDAIVEGHHRLFHSTLSPLINIGLLTPLEVVTAAISYGEAHQIPSNNIEGFIRQIIGWREFIRASYECDGTTMRTRNFWNHNRKLPPSFWNGATGILPIDAAIKGTLRYGYNHHIERLMVLGNFMLLTEINPDEVYRWFMAMYVDAYDWVMVPNVYGMSQFADGGNFATKPYISGSNYLKKMSNYPGGDWEEIWTALYWHFIHTHHKFFEANHRLSMMPRLFANMAPEKQSAYLARARDYLYRAHS